MFARRGSPASQATARHAAIPAPTRGWVTSQPLAAQAPDTAVVLENWFPTTTGVRLRKGAERLVDIGSDPVTSLFSYVTAGSSKLFAATTSAAGVVGIYDVGTNPGKASSVAGGPYSGGVYSVTQFATSGGAFLIAVNGADDMLQFDGTTWLEVDAASSPRAITGVATADLSAVWTHGSRLWFVEKDTLNAWYLAADSIAGAAVKFPLTSIFNRGGSLLFGATWSSDSGDGMDDRCVFVTDRGEVAVYSGTDPASNFAIQGRYDIPEPKGVNGWLRIAGDLLILTREGMFPMSSVTTKDPAALSLSAVSRPIETDWRLEAARRTLPWEVAKWDERDLAFVSLPGQGPTVDWPARCFAVHLETGAWADVTGWDARCWEVWGGQLYFGTNAGTVLKADVGGLDDGSAYVCKLATAFLDMGAPGAFKNLKMCRATFLTGTNIRAQISAGVDYITNFPDPPDAASLSAAPVWDASTWDASIWDGAAARLTTLRWQALRGSGLSASVQIQVTQGDADPPQSELMTIDVTYETGGVVY